MYMPSYKLNNSYTVYVNYVYLNECIKAGKQHSKPAKASYAALKTAKIPNKVFSPLPVKTVLQHKKFGFGKVISTDKNGIMSVAFQNKVVKFVYPDAVKQGFLAMAN